MAGNNPYGELEGLFGGIAGSDPEAAQAAIMDERRAAFMDAFTKGKPGDASLLAGMYSLGDMRRGGIENDPRVVEALRQQTLKNKVIAYMQEHGLDTSDPSNTYKALGDIAGQEGNLDAVLKAAVMQNKLTADRRKAAVEQAEKVAHAALMQKQAGVVDMDAESRRIAALHKRSNSKTKPYTPSAPTGSQISGLKDWIASQEDIAGFMGTKPEKGWKGEKDIFLTTVARDLHDRTETRIAELVAKAKAEGYDPEYDRMRIREEEFDKIKQERIVPGKERFFGMFNKVPEYKRGGANAPSLEDLGEPKYRDKRTGKAVYKYKGKYVYADGTPWTNK